MNSSPTKSIILAVGKSCFVGCTGCYNHFSKDDLISIDEIVFLCKLLKEKYKVTKVTISGGDPLSRPDIVELLEEINNLGLNINLDTVGTAFLQDTQLILNGSGNIKKIPLQRVKNYIDILGIPLDGSSSKSIQMFRKGRPNILEETKEILSLSEKENVPVSINTVLHKGNQDELISIYEIISNYSNVFRWQIFQYLPTGPAGYAVRKSFSISDESYIRRIEFIKEYTSKFRNKVEINDKSRTARKNIYLLVDSGGTAWCPATTSKTDMFDIMLDTNNEQKVWGNIKDKNNLPIIIENVFKYQGD